MGQAAAFLNGLLSGYERTSAIQRENRNDERQAKQDKDEDERRAKQKAMETEMAANKPTQDIDADHTEAMSLYEKNQASMAKENEARRAVNNSQESAVNPAAANGISFASAPSPQLQQPDGFSAPKPNSPISNAVKMGIPLQEKPAEAPPEKRQPTMADALNYQMRNLQIKSKYGQDVGKDLIELTAQRKKMDDEGLTHAYALLHRGDYQDAEKAFNSVGKNRGWKLEGAPIEKTVKIDGQEMPTKIATFILPNGEKRVIDTAHDMSAMINFDNQIKYGQEGMKAEAAMITANAHKTASENKEAKDKMPELSKLVENGLKTLAVKNNIKKNELGQIVSGKPEDVAAYTREAAELEQYVTKENKLPHAVNLMIQERDEAETRQKFANKNRVNSASAGTATPPAPQPGQLSIPRGMVVGAPTKQADGQYSAKGKTVTIAGGKITEIK